MWFNVPHGPQKQVDCFIRSYQCYKAGKEQVRAAGDPLPEAVPLPSDVRLHLLQEFCAALVHTPFSGCKGESMNPSSKSGLRVRC